MMGGFIAQPPVVLSEQARSPIARLHKKNPRKTRQHDFMQSGAVQAAWPPGGCRRGGWKSFRMREITFRMKDVAFRVSGQGGSRNGIGFGGRGDP